MTVGREAIAEEQAREHQTLTAQLADARALLEQRRREYSTLTDDFHGVTARLSTAEWRLSRIVALCGEAARGWTYGEHTLIPTVPITDLKAIIEAPPVGAAQRRDSTRDALIGLLRTLGESPAVPSDFISIAGYMNVPDFADAILAVVRPADVAVTREQLRGALFAILEEEEHADFLADRILQQLEATR